ncbi:hypothetical protein EV649_7340 [Kribbella sp. VKM Ac-2569]|uniref:hypothetical protein n=1 Tax=Kribbella sp. VKM Ac-2569 TaxID=2512220 RepID=UPI00102B4F79|nr:hypothetical protein [Kribbella sp. VKM Ac-2569]RZT11690.1 hypothetical protein EV649_7340 [Kribbella sp. VKM Ac-2569]
MVDWFTMAVEQLAGEFMAELPAAGLPSKGVRDPEGGPFGPVGSRWCSLLVIGQGERRLSKSLRAWSPKNWDRFVSQAADVSVEMSAKFSTLNEVGHAGTPSLTISAYRPRPKEARQWLRLDATYVVGKLGETAPIPDEVPETWRQFLVTQAERSPAVFGFLADDTSGAGNRTPLETSRGTFPTDTLPLSDSQVRGYSWVSVTSAGVLQRLGGIEAVRRSGAFASAIELPSGGAVLQATPRLSQYEGDAVRRVFEALAPVLPADAPSSDPFNRFKLIYEAPRR